MHTLSGSEDPTVEGRTIGSKDTMQCMWVRYKSGRLLPEYRPAKSPTFVSYLHSNSHKKVMEMRMGVVGVFSTDNNK